MEEAGQPEVGIARIGQPRRSHRNTESFRLCCKVGVLVREHRSNGVLISGSNSHVLNGVNLVVNTPSHYGEFKKVGVETVWNLDDFKPWKPDGFGFGRV